MRSQANPNQGPDDRKSGGSDPVLPGTRNHSKRDQTRYLPLVFGYLIHFYLYFPKTGKAIANENGVERGVECFHKRLPINHDDEWVEEIYEYQSHYPVKGWTNVYKHKVLNRYHWMDRTGTIKLAKKKFKLPEGWEWTSDWTLDVNLSTDEQGWQYRWRHRFEQTI